MEAATTFDTPTHRPVTIRHELGHKYVPKEKRPGMKSRPPGCATCGEAKTKPFHHATPGTFNDLGSGDRHFYQGLKKAWEPYWIELLEATDLPRPCGFIYATGIICFPSRRGARGIPDQGNYRVLLEKTLGDALEAGGWLDDDNWSRYQFGDLGYLLVPGQAWCEITLSPEDQPRLLTGHGLPT